MIKSWVLYRYFGKHFLIWFLVFLTGLAGIIYLFEVAELFRRAADAQNVGLGLVLKMGLYKLPETVERILPFVVLFASIYSFWRLTLTQELIIARSAGVSVWQFMMPALAVTMMFGLINVMILNPIGAVLNGRYRDLDQRFLQHAPSIELTGAGLWLRQNDATHHYLLHADSVDLNPLRLWPLILFVYDQNNQYVGRIDSSLATLTDNQWKINAGWANWHDKPSEYINGYSLPTTLSQSRIQESMAPPNTISFWELPKFIHALKTIGLPSTLHLLAYHSLLAQPLLLVCMIYIAAAFVLRLNRRSAAMRLIVGAILCGITLFMLNSVVNALGTNQSLPIALAAWAIPLSGLILGNAALLHLEDG